MGDEISVLHVDDEPGLAEMVGEFLERESDRLTVTAATSATGALEKLADHDFECIISDYEMPGRDGIEFLTDVREEYPDLPFVLYTGNGSEEIASDAISTGATDYLQKESGTGQYAVLANKVTNAVEQYRTQRDQERRHERRKRQSDALLDLTTDDAVTTGDFDRAIERITETAAAVLDISRINVWFFDDDRETLQCLDHFDTTADSHADEGELVVEDYPEYVETVESNRVIVAPDAFEDHRTAELDEYLQKHDVRALLDATIRSEGEPIGVVCHEHVGSTREWTEDEIEFATNIADLVHRAWRNREHVQRTSELEKTQARFRALTENTTHAVVTIDDESTIQYVTEPIEDILGYPSDELLHESLLTILPERFSENHRDAVTRYLQDGTRRLEWDSIELPGRHRDGHEVPLGITFGEARIDDEHRFTALIRDITERKERERRLRGLNETANRLMTPDTRERVAEIGVEAAATVLGLDASAIQLYDAEQDALVPVAGTDAAYEIVGELPTFTEGNSIAWRTYEKGEVLALDDVHEDPDVYDSETPIRSELHLPLGSHGIMLAGSETPEEFDQHDIVFGEILADAITAALEQVERTEQLRARERELSRQNERLETFASIVSHDLRNPLNVAAGELELAREENESDHLDAVASAHERMDTLINELLTLARHGEEIHDIESVDLAALTERCWQSVATAEATLSIDTDQRVQADRSRLRQLFENLIRNGVEHGGETVTITVGQREDGFYVEDDGPGIPDHERDDVFEVGYSTTADGTGIGLAIVDQVADAHGWDVRMTDGSDGGTRFEITGLSEHPT
ncbi:PAS domain S-box-containing protein [Halomicrobium zhouii]|uniref:histidine kinase n=1 Tax=Halomicrobium zhouii TaxID=767519 RepID=A0A1I6L2I1_9EURY|nr:response regulator [Halomicrobium zhouii]SFR97674.1 PAS domain S-box-containing protein [Halomicrobium zhouii]